MDPKTPRILMIKTIALLLWLCLISSTSSTLSAAESGSTVFELSGNGSRNTRPFTVKDHWEIRWSTPGNAFALTIYRADPKDELDALGVGSASQHKPGTGSSYFDAGGHYYLKITSTGDWTITVTQLP